MVVMAARHRNKDLADNWLSHNALFDRLQRKGNVMPIGGGRTIVEEVEYASNSTGMWYTGYQAIDISAQTNFDAAEYSWKQLAVSVSINGLEGRVQNAGKEQIIPLLDRRMKNAEKSLQELISIALYSDGTTANQLGGLLYLVAKDPTTSSTVGGINQSTYSWWRNYTSGDLTTPTKSNIQGSMKTAYLNMVRGSDKPDFWVADANFFTYLWDSLTDLQRFTQPTSGTVGFTSVKFLDQDVFYDDQCTTNAMFAIDTDYLYLRPHTSGFYTADKRASINQDAKQHWRSCPKGYDDNSVKSGKVLH